jgi:hypothetical protein
MKMRPLGRDQRVLVIGVKLAGVSFTRFTFVGHWVAILNDQVNHFYERATYGRTTFLFEGVDGGPSSGWFPIADSIETFDINRSGQAAIDAVSPYVNFAFYNRVLIITNDPALSGRARSGASWRVYEGAESMSPEAGGWVPRRQFDLAAVSEGTGPLAHPPRYDDAVVVAIHEIGHMLDVPIHYGDVRWSPGLLRDTVSPWDVMGVSPPHAHFLGWPKLERGFLDRARVMTIGPPAGSDIDQTVTLHPLEWHADDGVQLLLVPFSAREPFTGFAIENRQQIGGDERLPQEGVLVSVVDAHPDVVFGTANLVLAAGSAATGRGDLGHAAMRVGDAYADPARKIEISVISQSARSYDVRVRYPRPSGGGFDLAITPSRPPWEWTSDIWIDNDINGWDVYRYTDAEGTPVGQGDDAWVGRINRVWVQIRNYGRRWASNVRVQVFANQPPVIGDPGPHWQLIGTIVFPAVPPYGVPVREYCTWRPVTSRPTCLRAVIQAMPGETTTSNNAAQLNIASFESFARKAWWSSVTLTAKAFNPSRTASMRIVPQLQNIPHGWGIELDPPELTLPPGGSGDVKVVAHPSGAPDGPPVAEGSNEPGFIGRLQLDALAPHGDAWVPVGCGVELWTHLVHPTRLWLGGRIGGDGAEVEGRLDPAPEGTRVAVELRRGEERLVRHAEVGTGTFHVDFALPDAEGFVAQAFYAGDLLHAAAQSPVLRLERVTQRRGK